MSHLIRQNFRDCLLFNTVVAVRNCSLCFGNLLSNFLCNTASDLYAKCAYFDTGFILSRKCGSFEHNDCKGASLRRKTLQYSVNTDLLFDNSVFSQNIRVLKVFEDTLFN